MRQYIGFKLNENEYTIPILKVREIINTPPITGLPRSPHYVKGVINLRGRVVPVIDLRELMAPGSPAGASSKVIVIAGGKSGYGMLVDSITSVINIDESRIEAPEGFMREVQERVEGVAKLDDRLLILLDTDRLVELGERAVDLEEEAVEVVEGPAEARAALPGKARAIEGAPPKTAPAAAPPGDVTLREILDSKEALSVRLGADEQKVRFINSFVDLLDTLSARDFNAADVIISEMMQSANGSLFRKVGQVTRKLHESIKEFRAALDPRIKKIANVEVPNAVDRLEFVLEKTSEATHKTMGCVEKYQSALVEFDEKVRAIKSPKAAVEYLKGFRNSLRKDLNEIIVAQEYQDITGQAVKKVIELINDIETELVGLIATFGVKLDLAPEEQKTLPEIITQEDVEELLREFGF